MKLITEKKTQTNINYKQTQQSQNDNSFLNFKYRSFMTCLVFSKLLKLYSQMTVTI